MSDSAEVAGERFGIVDDDPPAARGDRPLELEVRHEAQSGALGDPGRAGDVPPPTSSASPSGAPRDVPDNAERADHGVGLASAGGSGPGNRRGRRGRQPQPHYDGRNHVGCNRGNRDGSFSFIVP